MRLLAALVLLGLAACGAPSDDGPVDVSVIGDPPAMIDPNRRPLDPPSSVLIGATAQGLARLDASAQLIPGAAVRWDVSDDGLFYTFRIGGELGIDARDAARRLRAVIARRSRNPLKPVLGAIDEIVAVTPQVLEIRLTSPRPSLLALLASPELGLLIQERGTGPFRIAMRQGPALLLESAAVPDPALEEQSQEQIVRRQVWLRGERAALAVARFAAGEVSLVLGGGLADLPIARAASPEEASLRFDPVAGLFGFMVADMRGFAGLPANRRALAMAIDRERIAVMIAVPNWRTTTTLVPNGTAELAAPARPDWGAAPLPLRREIAERTVAAWSEREERPAPALRVAMPSGPGMRLLFALVRDDWRRIGVDAVAVAAGAPADIRLVDLVAPADVASWYLSRFACAPNQPCSEQVDLALAAARSATTLAERGARLAEADARLAELSAFIAIGAPVRWSLVSPRLPAFRENARGVHPLDGLRAP